MRNQQVGYHRPPCYVEEHHTTMLIGFNLRLFPSNWRPVRNEIVFGKAHGFRAVQFPGPESGLGAEHLGDGLETVAALLREANLVPVMEILVRVGADGRTENGATPLDILHANLPAITALGCTCVHWHLAPLPGVAAADCRAIEMGFVPQCRHGVALAGQHGFRLGFEHNEPDLLLLAEPASCAALLEQVPGLGFVWDINHTTPGQRAGYEALLPRVQMLHLSDTPLPEVNYHLPIGLGTIEYGALIRTLLAHGFRGVGILKIGGLPKSGGYGRDTDDALITSLGRLQAARDACFD